MNKFEKINGDSINELAERVETPEEITEEKNERKFFSFFSKFLEKRQKSRPDVSKKRRPPISERKPRAESVSVAAKV